MFLALGPLNPSQEVIDVSYQGDFCQCAVSSAIRKCALAAAKSAKALMAQLRRGDRRRSQSRARAAAAQPVLVALAAASQKVILQTKVCDFQVVRSIAGVVRRLQLAGVAQRARIMVTHNRMRAMRKA